METIQLSYLLYNIDEVKYSFMLSLLFQREHLLAECLFWAYELYKSKQTTFLWNFITKIYYDFYYIKGASFEKQIDIEYNAWIKSGDFKHIAKTVKELHKQVPDMTIFQYLYANTNANTNTEDTSNIKLVEITADSFKRDTQHTLSYLNTLSSDEIKSVYDRLYRINRNQNMCLFYTNQKHRWIVKLVSKITKCKKVWIKTNLHKTDMETINLFEQQASRVYKTLKEKRLYEINPFIGAFSLARFKNETDVVKVWDENHYTFNEVDQYLSAYLYNWEFYARTTPFWKEVFDKYMVSFVKKKIKFPNDDMLEMFYDTYGFEPDEQSIETQNKSIKPIEESSINTCFESYNITLKSVIPQITYCVY